MPLVNGPPAKRARAMIAASKEFGHRVIEHIGKGRVVMERAPVAVEQGGGVVRVEWSAVVR